MHKATDWNAYYRGSFPASRITRRITERRLVEALSNYGTRNVIVAELGGANSCVLDAVVHAIGPREYHIIDNNAYGLELLQSRNCQAPLVLHNQSVLALDLDLQADVVFSLGLIEHFDPPGTREAILAHLRILKAGGIAVISFPTPTLLYRATRRVAEWTHQWAFPDERPLWSDEIRRAIDGRAAILSEKIIWPIVLTQTMMVMRKG
jgi:SAM-dependent methyltransferase